MADLDEVVAARARFLARKKLSTAKRALHAAIAAKEADEDAALAQVREKHKPLIAEAEKKAQDAKAALEAPEQDVAPESGAAP